jgi:uncharacterized protein YabN with tetrapyrrole methylase and pyrophosphatase domain
MKTVSGQLDELLDTVHILRSTDGCPWDRKQTCQTLKKYLHEELSEIIESIDKQDWQNLCEELGDFLYLIVMLSDINGQSETFTMSDVIRNINEKLIRRHPHVFSDRQDLDEDTLRKQWQEIKEREKRDKK